MLYGYIKDQIIARELERKLPPDGVPEQHVTGMRAAVFTDAHAFVTGAVSKLIASAATYPHEVIRTRMREKRTMGSTRYSSIFRTVVTVASEEGVRGLYGGMSVHLLRTVCLLRKCLCM